MSVSLVSSDPYCLANYPLLSREEQSQLQRVAGICSECLKKDPFSLRLEVLQPDLTNSFSDVIEKLKQILTQTGPEEEITIKWLNKWTDNLLELNIVYGEYKLTRDKKIKDSTSLKNEIINKLASLKLEINSDKSKGDRHSNILNMIETTCIHMEMDITGKKSHVISLVEASQAVTDTALGVLSFGSSPQTPLRVIKASSIEETAEQVVNFLINCLTFPK